MLPGFAIPPQTRVNCGLSDRLWVPSPGSRRRAGNFPPAGTVSTSVKRLLPLLLPLLAAAAYTEYASACRKLELIESARLARGARVELTAAELNAWVAREAAALDGVRNPRLQLGADTATGEALIDFGRVRRAQGYHPGWLMGKLLDGERPVKVTARIHSSAGTARVDVERVEISGAVIEGRALDFLIDNVLLPNYPDAAIGRPFELGHRIERLDVQSRAVGVVIGR